ncbi:hypothetical protein EBR66_07085 [bacterium]|nr:hypothetical protein [bacterium]
MSSSEENILLALIVIVVVYSLYTLPLGAAILSFGVAAISFSLTKSKGVVFVVLVAGLFTNRFLSRARVPMAVSTSAVVSGPVPMTNELEGFQSKDPVSVHTRLEAVKLPAPKVENITGVLESPSILDNTPLQAMDSLAIEGVPGASIPASAKARVLIYPPSEHSMPRKESMQNELVSNPYLQTGQDHMAEEVARAEKGTDIYAQDSSSIEGVAAGAGPAF